MQLIDIDDDSLYGRLEAPAAEGAQPAHSTNAELTPAQRAALAEVADDSPALWLAAVVAVAACAASALFPWGFA
jgi:hypothetical protein